MNKQSFVAVLAAAALLVGVWGVWEWVFCRFYVGPNEIAVITAKSGEPLAPGQILAKENQRGVREEVLAEGRHFLNPVAYDHAIHQATIIPPGKIGIVTAKSGTPLPAGEFLADAGQAGIWRKVLGPGKYRLNPVGYSVEMVDAINVPIGYVGVVTSLSGAQAPEGEFAKTGEKGVRGDILQPGLYYVNPRQFKVDVVEVGVNQVSLVGKKGGGVITKTQIATNNTAMEELQRNVLAEQQAKRKEYFDADKASQGSISSFGASQSYSNAQVSRAAPKPPKPANQPRDPYACSKPADKKALGQQEIPTQAAFILNQGVEFPSKDGFEISLDMSVEFELLPENIAWVFRNYGDLPAAVDKVIMPQILSISRLKGSAYGARDFIVGDAREKFQADLTEALAKVLAEKKIIIHNALIRHVNVPEQILTPIQQASVAQEQDLTNQERQNTAKKQAELNTQLSMVDQAGQQVLQETEKIKAGIKANQIKQVAEIGGETLRLASNIEKQTAGIRAQKTTTLGKAAADVVRMVEGEKATGYQMKIKAFGDPVAYNLWTLASSLDDDLKINILHSGPGTLWTDLQKSGMGDLGGAKLIQQSK
ncbi:MAG: SPFH domain-containing protein [Verrucomicrobiota bacterium]